MEVLSDESLKFPFYHQNSAMSENPHLEIATEVSSVTVFTRQALIKRTGSTNLRAGKYAVDLTNLPHNVQENTVQVSGNGDAVVTLVDFRIQAQSHRDLPKSALDTLKEEKEKLERDKENALDKIAVVQRQVEFLQGIGVHTSEAISSDFDRKTPDVSEWKNIIEFLGHEGNGLNVQLRNLEQDVRDLDEKVKEIDFHLAQADNSEVKLRRKVNVELLVETEGNFTFEVSYLSNEAHWMPQYDARVNTESKAVQLRYYGTVTQRTGEDWSQVQVLLSTARPHLGGKPPQLHAWQLSMHVEYLEEASPMALASAAPAPKRKKSVARSAMREESYGGGGARMQSAEVVSGEGASVVFSPLNRSDVPGNGTPSRLLVMENEFANEFRHLTVPKLAAHVYLTTEVTNSTEYPLLPGEIRLFLNGNFVGNSRLSQLITPGEKFELHLGVNEAFKVKHELRKRFDDEKGLLSKSRVRSFEYVITLDNQGPTTEKVVVRDQLPVSTDDNIKVKTDYLRPETNPNQKSDDFPLGTLEWVLEMESRQKQTVEFGFTVSHGREDRIVGL